MTGSRPRVAFDPNVRTTSNLTCIGLEDLPAGLEPGDEVDLVEEESGLTWTGVLVSTSDELRVAYLTQVWSREMLDALARRRAEGHRCVVPGCGELAACAALADENGRLAGREWRRGDFIDVCAAHFHDLRMAAGQPPSLLSEWLRADAEEMQRRRGSKGYPQLVPWAAP